MKALFMGAQLGASNALYTVRRRRFDRQFTATRFQSFDRRVNLAAGLGGHVLSKPFGQHIGIGNGGFSEAEPNTNLSSKTFGRAAYQECIAIHRDRDVELPAQCRDSLRTDFRVMSWEPTTITEERQQDGEAEPRFVALGHHQGVIGWYQSPRIVGAADAVRHAATSVVAVKLGSPIRARVSSNVVRLTPKFRHTAALDMPPFRAARTASSFSPEIAAGRPPTRPRRRAAANPATTRSRVRARSYWASAPNTWNNNSPDAVVVSMPSVSERKATCLSFSAFTMESKCESDRPSRSSFQTRSEER